MNDKRKPRKIVIMLLFCFLQIVAFAQEKTITGRVTSADGEGLPGATVAIKGTTSGTIADFDGYFSIKVPDDHAILVFSYIGCASMEISISGVSNLNITLEEDLMKLEEIVVMGYGAAKKSDVTGAMTSIKDEDFNRGVVTSPEQLIQGRISGVQITSNNGEPGAGMNVKIRGTNSIRSNTMPLYVVDGVPLDIDHSSPDGANTGAVSPSSATNPMSFINPDDIESIDVLKDASAAAIYGARGANGVVIITTKKGKSGMSSVNYSAYLGISHLRKKIDVLSADEFVQFRRDSIPRIDTSQHFGYDTDWQDEIFCTGVSYSHNISLTGGNNSTTYRASVNYLKQQGIIDKSDMDRITGRINLGQKAIKDKLYLELNLTASQVNEDRVPVGGTSGYQGDVILNALQANPTMPAYNPDGTVYQHMDINIYSPVALLEYIKDNTRTNRILANASITFEILKGLSYKLNGGFDNAVGIRRIDASQRLNFLAVQGGLGAINSRELQNYVIEHTLNYTKTFGMHNITLLAGYSYQSFLVRGYNVTTQGYSTDEILYTYDLGGSTTNLTSPSSYGFINELQSFFGRINYNLSDKYLFTITHRMDGSSKFGANNKYGQFPSLAFAWRISQESFMRDFVAISNLKIRLGWGITGNQEISGKNSLFTLGTSADAIAFLNGTGPTQGYVLQRTPNENIKWESSAQYNGGLDFGLFKGRLSGTIDLFYKETKNMLLEITPYQPTPSSRQIANIDGKIINKGIEIGLTGYVISQKDLDWSLSVNFTKINNIVKDLPVTLIETGRASGRGYTATRVQVITNDQPINVFYGYKWVGYTDRGYDAFEQDTAGSNIQQVLGSPHPDFFYNISSSVRYKKFDFGINFEGVYGNLIFNNARNIIGRKANLNQALNAVPEALNTAESILNPNRFSDKWLESGSFFRCSNITLGYTIPCKADFWMRELRVYASGSNLFLITKYKGYDPDVNTDASYNNVQSMGIDFTNYPKPRTFMVGLSVTF